LAFEQMVDDTAALLRPLKIEEADFFGWSDGGIIALQIAIRHPELVRKLVVTGSYYNHDGMVPEVRKVLAHLTPEDIPELREAYAKTAPNPEHWPTLVAKVKKLGEFEGWQGWRLEDIRSINAPALVMVGDADIVRLEHAVQMLRLLPHAQLAVLPGTDHGTLLQRPDGVVSMIEVFLNAPMPKAK
jgi:pimeloyl-ACP methyl ester carboxylesterase